MDSADYAADTNITDTAAAVLHFSIKPPAVTHGCFHAFFSFDLPPHEAGDGIAGLVRRDSAELKIALGGILMKSALLVLALAVYTSAGCRCCSPGGRGCGQSPQQPACGEACGCGDSCSCGDSCNCGDSCGGNSCGNGTCAGCLQNSCVCNGQGPCGAFNRYCGGAKSCGCDDGCGTPGPYDCSACNSPNWGCNGYGYCQGQGQCQGHCRGICGGHPMMRNGYCACCGQPGPSCCCSSGDQRYNFNPGPPIAQTAYPYYTLRGPRDFLLNNPPKLGPY